MEEAKKAFDEWFKVIPFPEALSERELTYLRESFISGYMKASEQPRTESAQ